MVNHPKTQEENSLEMSSEAAEKMNMYETMMESLVSDDSRFMLDGKKKFSSSIEVTLAYFLQIDGRFKN